MAHKTLADFIRDSNLKHNNRYSYIHIVELDGMSKKYPIECSKHGIFHQTASGHQRGGGCPTCANESNGNRNAYTFAKWHEKALALHGSTYDYSLMFDLVFGSTTKVPIICQTHGIFHQRAGQHISYGTGCKKCTCTKQHLRLGKTEIIKRCMETHGGFYDYANVNDISHTKEIMNVICPNHGAFEIMADKHSKGGKCPDCQKVLGNSRKQHKWLNELGLPNDVTHREVKIQVIDGIRKQYLKVDGYDESTNTIYEFWGDYWHGNPAIHQSTEVNRKNKKTMGELYSATLVKRERIIAAGYNLIEIWESEWDDQQGKK